MDARRPAANPPTYRHVSRGQARQSIPSPTARAAEPRQSERERAVAVHPQPHDGNEQPRTPPAFDHRDSQRHADEPEEQGPGGPQGGPHADGGDRGQRRCAAAIRPGPAARRARPGRRRAAPARARPARSRPGGTPNRRSTPAASSGRPSARRPRCRSRIDAGNGSGPGHVDARPEVGEHGVVADRPGTEPEAEEDDGRREQRLHARRQQRLLQPGHTTALRVAGPRLFGRGDRSGRLDLGGVGLRCRGRGARRARRRSRPRPPGPPSPA